MAWLNSLRCWWRGHQWKETEQLVDADEWMGDREEDAIHVYERCSCCGEGRWVFFAWGTLADYEREIQAGK